VRLKVNSKVQSIDSSLLVLDDATSCIDPYTELVIQNALKNILKNRMAIIIAHRLLP